jgi:hypothetical protein
MRAEGASIPQIRAMLKSHDVERSHRGVQVMLASRVYLGEIHFGEMVDHCRVDAPLTFVSSAML